MFKVGDKVRVYYDKKHRVSYHLSIGFDYGEVVSVNGRVDYPVIVVIHRHEGRDDIAYFNQEGKYWNDGLWIEKESNK